MPDAIHAMFGIDADKDPFAGVDRSKLKHPWKWVPDNLAVELRLPAKTYAGPGHWFIWFTMRPGYCDRGRWHCCVEAEETAGPDGQEGFPRYYFNLERGLLEMEEWIAARTELRP